MSIVAGGSGKIKPNGGNAKPHGNTNHNGRIDNMVEKLRNDPDVSNIRKNQAQADVNGNKVGNNRPDLQFDKNGKHTNVEWDHSKKSSENHKKRVDANDPEARNKYYTLKKGN